MKDVIGFGALNVDTFYEINVDVSLVSKKLEVGEERSFKREELSPLLEKLRKIGKFKGSAGGGSATNVVYALSKLGFKTGYITKAGNDEFSNFSIHNLGAVDTSGIVKGKGDSSICVCLLDENKNRTLCVFPSTVRELTIDEVLGKVGLDWTFDTKFLHLTSMVGDTSFETQKYVVKNTPSHVKISFDPGMLYAERGLDALLPIIEKSYVIFANDKEIERITGKNYERGVKELLKYSEIVACKLGEEGSKVFYNDKEIYTPITKVEVVDTTGAGDVYDAGFLAGLLLNKSLNECAQLATEAASLSITDYGRKRYPDSTLLRRYGWA